MLNFPPIPDWDGLHPLVVHFPVALLLVSPIIVLLGILWKSKIKGIMLSALVVMILGTIGAYVASSTGEAGGELVERNEVISNLIEEHEESAESVVAYYTILTAAFALFLIVPIILRKELSYKLSAIAGIVIIIAGIIGGLMVANTAHMGGTLVHEHGVKAMIGTGSSQAQDK